MVSLAILGESGVLYDIDKFHYLGSPYSTYHSVFVTRKDAGFDSLDKLRAATGVKIGGQSVGFSTYNEGRLFVYMLGLKEALFIAAFGGAELDPAMMRGEIDGRATGPDTILSRNRDWLDKGLVNIHAIMETPKGDKHPHPVFAKLPEIETFAKNDRERKMLALQRGFPRHRHAIRAAAGNTEGSRRHLEGGFPQDLSGSGFRQRISKTHRRRSVAAAAGKSREGDQRSAARPGSDRAVQNNRRPEETAAAVTYERSNRSSRSSSSRPLTERMGRVG